MRMTPGQARRRGAIRIPVEDLERLMTQVADEAVGTDDDRGGRVRVKWTDFCCTLIEKALDAEVTGRVVPTCAVGERDIVVLDGIRLRFGARVELRFRMDPPMRRVLRGRVVRCREVAAHVFAAIIRFRGVATGRRLVEIATGAANAPTA